MLFLFAIAEMKATSKLRPSHPSTTRDAWVSLSVNCPHADITSSIVPYFSSFTLFYKVSTKCALLKAKGLGELDQNPPTQPIIIGLDSIPTAVRYQIEDGMELE